MRRRADPPAPAPKATPLRNSTSRALKTPASASLSSSTNRPFNPSTARVNRVLFPSPSQAVTKTPIAPGRSRNPLPQPLPTPVPSRSTFLLEDDIEFNIDNGPPSNVRRNLFNTPNNTFLPRNFNTDPSFYAPPPVATRDEQTQEPDSDAIRSKGPILLPYLDDEGQKRSLRQRVVAINPSVDDVPSDLEDNDDYVQLLQDLNIHIFQNDGESEEEDEDEDEAREPQPLADTDIGTSFLRLQREQNRQQVLDSRPRIELEDRKEIRLHLPANNPPKPLPPDPLNPPPPDSEPDIRYPTSTPTQIATFAWLKINRISKDGYQQFMRMRKQKWWNDDELPLSYTVLQQFADFLPTDPIYSHTVEVEDEEGDSSTRSTADCFFFKVEDVVSRGLRNPEIFDHCHFGLAKEENPIVESYNAIIGGVWPSSILAAKGKYPIQPPSWRNSDGLRLSRNLMVFPGATVLLHMGTFLLPARISGVFESDRIWEKFSAETGEKFKSHALNKIWLTVNPVLVTSDDLSFFGVEDSKSREVIMEGMGPMEGRTQKGVLLLHDFVVPVDSVVAPVVIRLRRTTEDGRAVTDTAVDMRDYLQSINKPMADGLEYDVREMVVPERESSINHLLLHHTFVSKQGLIYSSHKQASGRTWKDPPPSSSRVTRATTAGASPGPKTASPLMPSSPSKGKGVKRKTTIVVYKRISISHCSKALGEGEIEKGEIDFSDLLFVEGSTRERGVDANGDTIITVCIDYYIDKFGVFRTTHRSVGGMYMTFHNLNHKGRDQSRNHFVMGFSPNGASTQDSSVPLVEELRYLAKDGFRLELKDGSYRVFVKLLSVSADMAEANALAGCKAAGALVPCRFCELKRALFSVDSFFLPRAELQEHLRQDHDVAAYRDRWEYTRQMTVMFRDKGLVERSVFDLYGPSFNQYIQVALDIAHSEQKGMDISAFGHILIFFIAGIGEEMLSTLVSFLTDYGSREIARVTRTFKLPPDVSRIPNIGKRIRRLKMSEVTLLISFVPFMLDRVHHEKPVWKDGILQKMNADRSEPFDNVTFTKFITDVFDSIAKANKVLFKREVYVRDCYAEDPYLEIERILLHSRKKIFEMMEPLEKHAQASSAEMKEWFENAGSAIDKEEQRRLLQRERPGGGLLQDESEEEEDEDMDTSERDISQLPDQNTSQANRRNTRGSQRVRATDDDDFIDEHNSSQDDDEQDEDEDDADGYEPPTRSVSSRKSRGANRSGRGMVKRGKATKRRPKTQKKGKVRKSALPKPRNPKSSIASLPNFHTSAHAPSNSRRYGTSLNTATSVGEIQHQLWKSLVLHSNLVDLDLVFCKYANVLGALRGLLDRSQPKTGWPKKHPWEENIRIVQGDIPELFTGYALGQIARSSAEDGISRNKRGEASKLKLAVLQRFPDIKLGTMLSSTELKEQNYESSLVDRDMVSDPLIKGLSLAYQIYGFGYGDVHMTSRLLKRGCRLFWWSSITLYDAMSECRYTYRPGSVISIDAEVEDGKTEEGFVEIRGICTHQNETTDYIFLYVRWLYKVPNVSRRDMPVFRIQNWSDSNQALPDIRPPTPGRRSRLVNRSRPVPVKKTKWTNYIGLPSIRETRPPHFVKDLEVPGQFTLNTTYFASV
ncbi:hypothetical protein BJ508DRAFT_331326 [Ascobolus immersus RN42]|uniref:Uncharacterized protein n=1 Tax=Ascobolus immersus RN42 TaxID=1160509 RepID=A0A3N4I319_ASCIM|nr:hypothetical protein BJ508DRAFT_331326 [Ascobolus immersus RN42]